MKKVLSFILVIAMLMSSMSIAFAIPSDVDNTDYENAVSRLIALEIIVGYEDGTFRPEKTITRAEFAAIAMRTLGLADVAAGSVASTKYSDVSASHWASGYINLASSKGVIVGYTDGSFKPEAQVTYAEAITMLVRVLGYTPSLTSKDWPSNYLSKAAEIGLSQGVKFSYNEPAIRGLIANLTNRALDIDLMDLTEVTSGDQTWTITDDTLLTKYLNVFELEEAYVLETATHSLGDLDADEVKVRTEDSKTYTLKLLESIDVDSVLGHEVTVFVKDKDTDGKLEDDELVISFQDTTDAKDVIKYDYIADMFEGKDKYDITEGNVKIFLDDTDDTFKVAEDAIVFYNYERVTDLANMAAAGVGKGYVTLGEVAGKVILNEDDEIMFMDMVNYDIPVVITDVNVKDEKVKYFLYNENESSLKLDSEDYQVFKNGKIADLEALKANDVLYFWEATSGEYILDAYDYKIEGTLESVDSDNNNYWDYTLVVDGKDISVGPAFTISTDENDTINSLAADPKTEVWTADDDRLSDLEDMIGEHVTVYIGKYFEDTEGWNYGRHITTGVDTDTDDYFVVTEEPWSSRTAGYKYYVELLNKADDEITYEFTEDETEFDGSEKDLSVTSVMNEVINSLPVGTLVDVEFNSDGTISAIDIIKDGANDVVSQTANANGGLVDDDYDRITINSRVYYISDSTVFYGVNQANGEVEAYTWGAVSDLESGDAFSKILAKVDDSELEVVAFYHNGSVQIGEDDYGYVLKREIKSDGLWVHMAVEDKVVTYFAGDLSKSTQNALQEKALVDFTVTGETLDTANIVSRTKLYASSNELTANLFNNATITVTTGSSIKSVVSKVVDGDSVLLKNGDTLVATWKNNKITFETGYSDSNFEFAFDKFEIVSGGVDTKNGIIEVMVVGTDEDQDKTWFIDVDKYGADTFYYDVDKSHRNLDDKILTINEMNDGDMVYIYDIPDTSVTEFIAIYDR